VVVDTEGLSTITGAPPHHIGAGYRADRLGRARSIASHPSNFSEHDNGDHADGNHGGGIEDIEDVNR
jgi:hypothetical protein